LSVSSAEFGRRVVIVGAVVAVALLVWRLIDVVLLVFGGIILAVSLVSLSRLVMRYVHLRRGWALVGVICILTIGILGLGALAGARLAAQFGELGKTLEAAWTHVHQVGFLRRFLDGGSGSVPVKSVSHLAAKAATGFAGGVVDGVLVVVVGVFLAANPQLYVRSLLRLTPRGARSHVKRSLDALGTALSRWLRGLVIAMLSVGVATTLGLFLLGIPLAFSLGVLAGVLEFISYVGPLISAIPAVLVAFTLGPMHALAVVGLFAAVHLLEAYVLVPKIQKWAVELPPALAVVAVVTFGLLFGIIGIILAQPLMVCVMALTGEFYVGRESTELE